MAMFAETARTPLRVETVSDGDTTRVVIRGEADIADAQNLAATLTGIQLDGTRSVRVDASDLAFLDVATLRCLTVFARMVRQTGRDITTCGATPMLQEMARLLELQDDLGLH